MTKKEVVVYVLKMLKEKGVQIWEWLLELVEYSKYVDDKIIQTVLDTMNKHLNKSVKEDRLRNMYVWRQMLLKIKEKEDEENMDFEDLLNNI